MSRKSFICCDQCGAEVRSWQAARDNSWLEVGPLGSYGVTLLTKGKLHADLCSMKCLAAWANAQPEPQPAGDGE